MSRRRIEVAKQALVLFLNSMPPDLIVTTTLWVLEVVLPLWAKKTRSLEEKIEKSINDINKFSADLGGTELFKPLEDVFKRKPFESYPKNIFLLIDGGIDNTKHVLELIAKNSKGCRIYTLGIVNGCSRGLITEGANAVKYKF